jgi:transposase-like protein
MSKITKEQLEELYVEKEMSIQEVADELGVHFATVRNAMKKHGVSARVRVAAPKPEKLTLEEQINAMHEDFLNR